MDYKTLVHQLKISGTVFRTISEYITQEQAVWCPGMDRWTVLEVINHLIDIEVEDFRYDMELILFHPEEHWPSFNIETWRVERRYNEDNLIESLDEFEFERQKSVRWLESLADPDLTAVHSGKGFTGQAQHAGDILLSWNAHDLFHIRQLSLLSWDILKKWGAPYSPEYSGFEI